MCIPLAGRARERFQAEETARRKHSEQVRQLQTALEEQKVLVRDSETKHEKCVVDLKVCCHCGVREA